MLKSFVPAGFRGRLFLTFLAISTLPLIATGVAFFVVLERDLERETLGKLSFATNAKRSEITQYLTFATRQAESLSNSNTVRYSIGDFYGFSYAFRQIDPSPSRAAEILRGAFGVDAETGQPISADSDALIRSALEYSNVHGRFHEDYTSFIGASEFDNIYLVNVDGRVVYSVEKDAYLGADLKAMMRATPLSDIALNALPPNAGDSIVFRDFQKDPLTGHFASYVAVRVEFYQRVRGVIVFRLPTTGIGRLVQSDREATERLYLLSSSYRVLTAPEESGRTPGAPDAPGWIPASSAGTSVVEKGLAGVKSLDAWASIGVFGQAWTLIAEIPTSVAFASTATLKQVVLLLALLSLSIIIGVVLYLSRSMTAPLEALTSGAEAIAAGDHSHDMPAIERPSEFGRLTASFRRMRDAVRDQLELINQKNIQLEQQLRLIEEKNTALQEADRQKDTFLANTSHELRTPLNGIIGISETLSAGAAGDLATPQRNQLQLITFSARRLSRLVDDLLDLYRIRQGRIRLDLQPVHVASSVRNVLQLSEPLFRGEPVTVRVDIPETTPFLLADPVRFEQILYNLLGNAIKYTDQGTIRIFAESTAGTVSVTVEDTGRGISADDLERMFQPMEQGDGPAVARSGGAGLGLTIARQLATVLHGELVAESVLGQGSKFTVRLPCAVPLDPATEPHVETGYHETINAHHPSIVEPPAAHGAPVILVVDDEPINVQVLRNVLAPQGYHIRTADNGPDAIRLVEKDPPDLIVLDVMMPGMTGLEVASRLRERHNLVDLPILMLTARSRTRDVIAGFESGANDYVVKPFIKDELLARVSTLIEARRGRSSAQENVRLRDEVERRMRVEDALRLSQQRMTGLLDSLAAALICINPQGTVTYANRAARTILGRPIELGTLISTLLPRDVVDTIDRVCRAEGEVTLENVRIDTTGSAPLIHALELEAEAGGGLAIILAADAAAARSEGLVAHVRNAIDSVGDTLSRQATGSSRAGDSSVAAMDSERDAYRRAVLEVMTTSLSLWTALTGKGRIEFAERSGIWRVTLDKSSLQTRTLDKYLLIETLPLKPRWRDVVRTAELVLSEAEAAACSNGTIASKQAALSEQLKALRAMLREGTAHRSPRTTADAAPPPAAQPTAEKSLASQG
jgi:two-component system, sensor histidine kinase ChiS